VFVFVFLIIIPGYKSASIQAAKSECQHNQNQIAGKIELAILEGKPETEIFSPDGSLMLDLPLRDGKPVACKYGGKYMISPAPERIVFCTFHGDLENRIPGQLDPGYNSFYWLKLWITGILK
jgi:hypothetical protein